MTPKVGVLTVSDRSARGERADRSGPAVAELVRGLGWTVSAAEAVPDDAAIISDKLRLWCDRAALDLVLTTGGTGFSPRDVTPEATAAVLERPAPGLAERMRREGERHTPLAALSRGVCGVRGRTLVVNLPGSPDGARQSLEAVAGLIPHALAVLAGADHGP